MTKPFIKHLMYVPFTGLGRQNGFRGNTWLAKRIKIFKNFVVPSLKAQTNKDFIVWVSWRPQERNNKLVQELKAWLDNELPNVFTYNGVCFWDDRYPEEVARERLINNLHWTMFDLVDHIECDYVYLTIQPSDDCYAKDAVETIQKQYPMPKLMGWTKGCIMNYGTKEIAEYNPTTTPPFFTHVFERATFIDPFKHAQFTGPYQSHEYVGDYLKYTELPGRKFLVGTHGENISTVFNHLFKGKVLPQETLAEFGIQDSPPMDFSKSTRVRLRIISNKLPPFIAKPFKKICYKLRLI